MLGNAAICGCCRWYFFLAVPLWVVVKKRQNSTAYILSRYAQINDGAIRQEHILVQQPQNYHNPVVLLTTWFPLKSSQGICAPTSQVRLDGSVEAWVSACGPTNRHALQNVSPEQLLTALRKLPPSRQARSEKHSLILSFCVDDNCTTRVYDRSDLPSEAKKIFQLTGAPIETR